MSLWLSSSDFDLQDFLRKAFAKERELRKLTPDEFGVVVELREIKKAANLCITEMCFTKEVIFRLRIYDLMWVKNNFERMVHSLTKQRDLIRAVSKAYSGLKPEEKELKAIQKLISDVKKRIAYINAVPIPENIRLTPIQDYMDLIGGDNFINEVKTVFPMSKDLYESQRDGSMDRYINEMMESLDKAGKAEAYKERLGAYIKIANEKNEAREREKAMEKQAYALNEAQNGILLFREQFFKGIRTLNGSAKIGLSASAISHHLKQGDRGKFCILCCKFSQNRLQYKYMKANGTFSPSFQNCGLYDTLQDAASVMSGYVRLYPDMAFEAVAI